MDVKSRAAIVWGLYLASVVTGVTAIVGVVLAYVWRSEAAGDPLASHFTKAIKLFWIALIGSLIGALLTLVFIGFLVIFAVAIYFLVMSVIGLMKALDDQPWT